MKICQQCQKEFKTRVMINGHQKNLCSRKFCLDCSPFGSHNTRDITFYKESMDTRTCIHCGVEKKKDEFGFRSGRVDKTYSMCKKCANMLKVQSQRDNKKQWVEYLGGKCKICGYQKNINALQFHHIDPTKKEFTIGCNHSKSFKNIVNELDKCVLLCANCHFELHGGLHKDLLDKIMRPCC